MASLVLGGIGGFIFGPIGFLVGSFLGNLLFPQKQKQNLADNINLPSSKYGEMKPIVYGTRRVQAKIIDRGEPQAHDHHTGGKGGPEVTTRTWSLSYDCLLTDCEIAGISKIWTNGQLVWSLIGSPGGAMPGTLYLGTQTQMPDPTFEAIHDVGNVPAYRGRAHFVFEDRDLAPWGNAQPIDNFEVFTVGAKASGIAIVKKTNTSPTHFAYRTSSGNFAGAGYAALTKWNMNGTSGGNDIHVTTPEITTFYEPQASLLGYSYDFNLVFNGTGSPTEPDIAADPWPGTTSLAIGARWYGIGTYVYADTTMIQLFKSQYATLENGIGATSQYAAIGAGSVFIDDPHGAEIPTGANFAFAAGVPSSEFYKSSALTQDGTAFFVFTAPTSGGTATKWYRIVDGNVDLIGSCGPGVPTGLFMGIGQASPPTAGTSCCMFENNRQYCWAYSTNGGALAVTVYSIIDGVFDVDPVAGHFPQLCTASATDGLGIFPVPPFGDPSGLGGGVVWSSCYVPAEGYCGVVAGTMMALLTRFVGGATNAVVLGDIVADISNRVALDATQYDVSELTQLVDGYLIDQQQPARDSITPLQSAYYFDGTESSGQMKFINRGGDVVVTIPDDDLGAVTDPAQEPAYAVIKRAKEADLPATLYVNYVDAAADYQTGTQVAQRQVTRSILKHTIDLNISLSASKARSVANVLLFSNWYERDPKSIQTSRKYAYLEPTDIVSARGYRLRIMQKADQADNICKFDGVPDLGSLWVRAIAGGGQSGFTPTSPGVYQPTTFLPLDIPLTNDDDDAEGFYAGMAGSVDSTWKSANLYKSVDGGSTYAIAAAATQRTVMGVCSTALPEFFGGNCFDHINSVTVAIGVGGGILSSSNRAGVLGGANLALAGAEVIQFQTATLVGAGIYKLTDLLRGRRGTEWAMRTHVDNERFVLLPTTDVPMTYSELGQARKWKPVSAGGTIAGTTAQDFTDMGIRLRPYSPCRLGGGVTNASGDVQLKWTPRTRTHGAWQDYVDVTLSDAENYVVQTWDASYTLCARIIMVDDVRSVIYTGAQQTTDFGGHQHVVYWSVGQKGLFTFGSQAYGTAPGDGSLTADGLPLNPIKPYSTPPVAPPPDPGPPPDLTLTWPQDTRYIPITIGERRVCAFTTGGSTPLTGTISVAEYQSQSTPRRCFIATDSGGLHVVPHSLSYGTTATSFIGSITGGAILAPSTTYYFIFDFIQPDGTLSGPPGKDAKTVLSLGNVT